MLQLGACSSHALESVKMTDKQQVVAAASAAAANLIAVQLYIIETKRCQFVVAGGDWAT